MATSVTTAWVAPPILIGGQDHLGVRAPCEAIYTLQVPGITNVTDRARYFSFYPWLLWSMDRHLPEKTEASVVDTLRRAECLLTMIGVRHAKVSGEQVIEGDEDAGGLHDLGLVGRRRLSRVVLQADGPVDIGPYASREDGQPRYFRNPSGGLGQYYFGPLRDLGLLASGSGGIPFGWGKERAPAVAQAFERSVDSRRFFDALRAPAVSMEMLDELSSFCPCALLRSPEERAALMDVLLARRSPFLEEGGGRRQTLGLLLDLASRGGDAPNLELEDVLRIATYTGALPGGGEWLPPARLEASRRAWRVYEQNELLSVALQGIFAGLLRAIEHHQDGAMRSLADAEEFAVRLAVEGGRMVADEPLTRAIERHACTMPHLHAWEHPDHELQLGWRVADPATNRARAIEDVFQPAVQLLLTLLARGLDVAPYAGVALDSAAVDPKEINLLSLAAHHAGGWRSKTAGEWIRWVATRWGIERHLLVALRKLRYEKRDTFQVRPGDEGFHVVGVPWPTFTGPRLKQSTQILKDLGLLTELAGVMRPTPAGVRELEAIHAR